MFQSLADNSVTGTLTLKNREGGSFGEVHFQNGKFLSCVTGKLTGETAFYQLLEKSHAGTFHFVRQSSNEETADSLKEVLPLILEGIRRYDEFGQARSILPDDARLVSKLMQPAQLREERDGMLFRELWTAVKKGATPSECEAMVTADAFRIRRLLVHWIETGCIEVRSDQ